MRKNLSVDELGYLLNAPLLATLATNYSDGSTLLSRVWFVERWRFHDRRLGRRSQGAGNQARSTGDGGGRRPPVAVRRHRGTRGGHHCADGP